MNCPNPIMAFNVFVARNDSSAIDWFSYDHKNRLLRIHFRTTNSTWQYSQVWPSDFSALCAAHSPGKVFNERIRGKYIEERIFPKKKDTPEQGEMFVE